MKRQARCPMLLIAALLLSPGAAADGYPAKPVKIITQGAAGSGIGLYVSRFLVRSYGGELRFEPLPEGSCFVIELEAGSANGG